ncbi:MAG: NAD(P)-dependent oxidoreductase [Deltaproteobacteria bacterium]|nr:NAD(P)-dependent oxidoreductase [Deltaproteobacteria bacterium]
MEPVGLIGAGVMGLTAASKILQAGGPLFIFDTSPEAQNKASQAGARLGASPAEVARQAEVILMFLPGPAQIIECVSGERGLLQSARPGTVVVDLSTSDPSTTRQMASLAREKEVGYLDAPVLGRPISVGQWALPVGGPKEDIDRCRPVFELFASKVMHIGPSGAGHTVKLLNQLMFSAINAMTAEMMAIADKVGVPPKLLYETITASQAGTVSNLFLELGKNISNENYENPTFSVDLLCKDARLAIQMAKANNAPPLLAGMIQFINEMAQAQGFGAKDTAVMWQAYKPLWSGQA